MTVRSEDLTNKRGTLAYTATFGQVTPQNGTAGLCGFAAEFCRVCPGGGSSSKPHLSIAT
ncbi:MAG: hypothetical protein ACJ746_19655 [Bryobacteraceae bacterium]